jgi:hypothetical protein
MEKLNDTIEHASVFRAAVDKMIADHPDPAIKEFLRSLSSLHETYLQTSNIPGSPAEIKQINEL